MAETARQVVTKALRLIWRTGENEVIQQYDMDLAIEELNNFMDELEALGVDLDHTTVTDQTDTMTIADGSLGPTKRCLSYRLWELYYRDQPQPITMRMYEDAYNKLLIAGQANAEADFPDSLPVGSGNEGDYIYTEHFFPQNDEVT